MANTTIIPIESLVNDYGALELKKFIKKHTVRGFIITAILFLLLILGYFFFSNSGGSAMKKVGPTMNKVKLQNLKELDENQVEEIAPPTQMTNSGPAARAGNPVPVPDAQITADMKDFATVEVMSRASSVGGEGVDLGGMSQNINFDNENKPKVNVEVREVEPAPDAFIAVEKDPATDMGELQKRVVYPEMAKRAGIEGKVIVRVLVGTDGRPRKMIVEYSDNELLNQAAKDAVKQSVFTPGIQNKTPVTVWVSIPIVFKLR